jgi:hypothetical protein
MNYWADWTKVKSTRLLNNMKCKLDMAAKRRKKYKNKISGLVNSMCYNEQKSKF